MHENVSQNVLNTQDVPFGGLKALTNMEKGKLLKQEPSGCKTKHCNSCQIRQSYKKKNTKIIHTTK